MSKEKKRNSIVELILYLKNGFTQKTLAYVLFLVISESETKNKFYPTSRLYSRIESTLHGHRHRMTHRRYSPIPQARLLKVEHFLPSIDHLSFWRGVGRHWTWSSFCISLASLCQKVLNFILFDILFPKFLQTWSRWGRNRTVTMVL